MLEFYSHSENEKLLSEDSDINFHSGIGVRLNGENMHGKDCISPIYHEWG